jgi:hypothetical protein
VVTCSLGTLEPGVEYTAYLGAIPVSAGTFVIPVTVSANETDSNPANNTASATTHAQALLCAELVQDGSFESGIPNSYWLQYSSTFGTPLCTFADCGNGGGTAGPATGSVWAWFGGVGGQSELGALAQDMVLPAGAPTTLRFKLWNGASSGNGADYVAAFVDTVPVFATVTGNPAYTGGYATVAVDVSAFADQALHRIDFESYTTGPQVTNFSLDDVSVASCPQLPPFLSVSDVAVTEAGPASVTATFTVSLSRPSADVVRVSWITTNGSAHASTDYIPASGNVALAPGATSATFAVTVLGDRVFRG